MPREGKGGKGKGEGKGGDTTFKTSEEGR